MNTAARPALGTRAALVLAGDLACFLLFALAGLRSHEEGITLGGVLRAAAPFQAGWLLASLVLGLQGAGTGALRAVPSRVLLAWLPAWLLGLGLRTLVFGRPFAPTFALISLLVNAALLVAWRTLILPRIAREHPSA